jgi:hypothetical protein
MDFKPQNSPDKFKTVELPTIEDYIKTNPLQFPETGKVYPLCKCTFHSACSHEVNGECNNFDTCSYQLKI